MVVGVGLKVSGTDGTRETAWFVLVSVWWLVVDRKRVGLMGQEKLHCFILITEWWWVVD
jgi:hypothetical protein